jgi:hypothetical protein
VRVGGVVVLFFLAFSDSGSIFLLSERLVSRADERCEKSLPGEPELGPRDPPPSAEPVATAPLPAATSALWRGGSRSWFFLGAIEKGLDRGSPEAGFPSANLPTGRLLFSFRLLSRSQSSAIWPSPPQKLHGQEGQVCLVTSVLPHSVHALLSS